MFMPFMCIVLIGSVPLLGGRLQRLNRMRIALVPLLIIALTVQILITSVITSAPAGLLVTLHLASYLMVAAVLWRNRRLPGLPVLGAGVLSNGITIALNGGTLPASARALRAAGYSVDPSNFDNSGVLAHPVLPWLGDVVATPSWLPLQNVVSVGDLLILLGATMLLHTAGRSVLWRALTRRRALEPSPAA